MTLAQLRLECLKMANTLAASKNIKPEEALHTAKTYFSWVSDDPSVDEEVTDTSRLTQRFHVSGRG